MLTDVRRPNILLITTDQQRCDTLACFGNPHAVSPHLDQLAREGVLFEQAYTSSPVCMPARSSLLTGVHAPIHGAIENGIARRTHLTVYPDLLKGAGYSTILVGKAHFGPMPEGFDIRCVVGEKFAKRDDPWSEMLRAHGLARPTAYPHAIPEELFMDAFLVDQAIRAIGTTVEARRGPFFAHCSLVSPHEPHDPPGRWAEVYRDRPLPPLNYREGELHQHPTHMHDVLGLRHRADIPALFPEGRPDLAAIDEDRRRYYGLAAYCDEQIGRLLRFLDTAGLRDDTLVIFTTDHGTTLFDHGFCDKHNYYDPAWRVPLLIRLPGILPAGARRDFAVWTDLAPTILAAAGLACSTMQGFDLLTPLARNEPSPRRCAVGTLYKSCAVATGRWKLEYYFEEADGRLFDRRGDPQEQDNLYDSGDHRVVRDELLTALLAWRGDLTDVQALQDGTSGGGPIAAFAAAHTRGLTGLDAERRLGDRLAGLDARTA